MASQPNEFYIDENLDGNDVLVQLRRLLILYHARGHVKEAQEIYELMLAISNKRCERDSQGGSTEE